MSEVIGTKPEQGHDKFHKLDCGMAEKTSPEHRERFESLEAAKEAGFRPCGVCFRGRYRKWREDRFEAARGRQNGAGGQDPSRHPRGVFHHKYRSQNGDEVLVAIDSGGKRVAEVEVTDPDRRGRLVSSLWRILDALDPTGWEATQRATERRGNLELVE